MKTKFLISFTVIISLFALVACKKESKEAHSSSFNNTVWTGKFHYTSQPVQPMSIEFKSGGQLTWHELSGDYTGTWKLENNQISVIFPSGSGFNAGITDDDKLINIQYLPGTGYAVDNAALNKDTEPILDGTTWAGPNIIADFKPGNLLNIEIGGSQYTSKPYTRKGGSIRFDIPSNYKWFIIVNSATSMQGINVALPSPTLYTFQLTKQ